MSCLRVRINLLGDAQSNYPPSNIGKEQIATYVDTVSFLLNPYATDRNITKTTMKIGVPKKDSDEISVPFDDVLRTIAVRFGNCYVEKQTERQFIERFHASIQRAVQLIRD